MPKLAQAGNRGGLSTAGRSICRKTPIVRRLAASDALLFEVGVEYKIQRKGSWDDIS
jgi:hypothetical protein